VTDPASDLNLSTSVGLLLGMHKFVRFHICAMLVDERQEFIDARQLV
jgi:hypothetical protein